MTERQTDDFPAFHDAVFRSDPMRIGKHDWRVVVTPGFMGRRCIEYEWRRRAETICGHTFEAEPYWTEASQWPRYNPHDGQHAGLPKTLAKLYAANVDAIQRARAATD